MRQLGLKEETQVVRGDYTDIAGVRAVEELLKSGDLPTAIFAANDFVAAGARDRLEDSGLVVPGDISLVGYDNTYLAAMHRMNLTTVNQPRLEMGRLAARNLIERIEQGRDLPLHERVTPELVVRGTTGPPARMPVPQRSTS